MQREILSRKFQFASLSNEINITDRDKDFIKNTISIIEQNCQNQDFNVSKLIEKSNLGRTVFYNKLKSLTGLSPVVFVRNIKLQIACKQLKENNCGVAEAAYIAGFYDTKYFTECFKKEFGVNPSEYKKREQTVFVIRGN